MMIGYHTIGVREKRLASDTCMHVVIESSAEGQKQFGLDIIILNSHYGNQTKKRLTDTCWCLSIEHSLCIIVHIIHTSSHLRYTRGEVQNKPSITGISGHSAQIIVRCGLGSVDDESISNGR